MKTSGDNACLLELTDVDVGYRKRGQRDLVVLSGITAGVRGGELVGLVGPNGAGKTTLLRSIANLQPLLGGHVQIDGEPILGMRQRQIAKKLSVVLTDRPQLTRLRVRDVVGLGRHPHSGFRGRLDADDHRIVMESLHAVAASGLADADIGELSDGQRQRVMVARALAQEPQALLLDEPTAFLDPPGRISLLTMLRNICGERNIAVVICTHDIESILRYADTLWVAGSEGHLVLGGPEDLAADGNLAAAFETQGVVFTMRDLSFRSVESEVLDAVVFGEGESADLARHALRRAGYRVENQVGDPVFTVEAQEKTWTICMPVKATVHSLAELHGRAVDVREQARSTHEVRR